MTVHHTLSAHDMTLAYGELAVVHDLTLKVPQGQVTAIVGANACGKSTVLRALSRLLVPRSGSVLLDGVEIHKQPTAQVARKLGLLPQSPTVPDGIIVSDLVSRGRNPHHSRFTRWSAADDAAVAQALELTGTADLAERYVDELSGGQRQRVWIAMALAQQTDVLLLDEPTTYLDVTHQIEVLDLLADLNQRAHTTIVMVLHDLNLSVRYADCLVVLRNGRLHAIGPPVQVMSERMVEEVFNLGCRIVTDPISGKPMMLPIGRHHNAASAAVTDGSAHSSPAAHEQH